MRLLIAIPVHNERKYVDSVLNQVKRYHADVLVVDDGSTDGTADILAGRSDVKTLTHPVNRGYGQSLIDAFDYAEQHGFDWVLTMDCDEQHEPEMIPEFIRQMNAKNAADVISGSRYLHPRRDDDLPPGDRRRINATLTDRINDDLHLGLTDAFCGYKAHRVASMSRLCLDEAGYAFPMQFWPQVAAANLRVSEIPVRLIYNDMNRSFGGDLDDAQNRLRHYLDVYSRETQRIEDRVAARLPVPCGCQD